jgi:hypothetical protein
MAWNRPRWAANNEAGPMLVLMVYVVFAMTLYLLPPRIP